MRQQIPTIVLTGGGTGGHITPLLSLAQELKKQSPDCCLVYIGNKGDSIDTFQQSGHDFDFLAFINAGKLRRYGTLRFGGLLRPSIFIRNLIDLFKIPGSIIKSLRILRKMHPNVIFSKGGFVALPVALAAKILKIPIVTHDSDAVPGLANRIIGRWASAVATGMPADNYDYPKAKVRYVGIPIDTKVKKVTPKLQVEYKKQLNLPKDSMVLLIAGGSSGSTQINNLITQIAKELLETHLQLHIIHLAGAANEQSVRQSYSGLNNALNQRVSVLAGTDEFYKLAGAADLIITRAGATTIAELAAAGKTALIIPSPHLAGGHQLKNAEILAHLDAAVVAPAEAGPDELQALINELLNDHARRFELARNLFATAKTSASKELATLLISYTK